MSELGRLTNSSAKRDALHVAIAPAECYEDILMPGERVGVNPYDSTQAGKGWTPCGIVDPFLTEPVRKWQWFNILIDPGTVTNLRHQWSHALFSDEDSSYGDDECRGC